jgi:hypothetical protein
MVTLLSHSLPRRWAEVEAFGLLELRRAIQTRFTVTCHGDSDGDGDDDGDEDGDGDDSSDGDGDDGDHGDDGDGDINSAVPFKSGLLLPVMVIVMVVALMVMMVMVIVQ